MRLIVPGGGGFVGTNFLSYIFKDQKLLSNFNEIVVLDILHYGEQTIEPEILKHEKISFLKESIYDNKIVGDLIRKNDVVIHLATEENTFENPQADISFNFGTYLRDLSRKRISKFIFISTADVYGVNDSSDLLESDMIKPTTLYSANKVAFEAFIQVFFNLYNFPAIIFRPVTIYGPRQHPGWLVPRVITKALKSRPIQITGDGSVLRDWIFVEDICSVITKALFADKKKIFGEIFNLGTGKERSVLKVTKHILKNLGKTTNLIEFIKSRPGEIPRQVTLARKARKTFNWKPQVNFFEGLDKTIEWYKNKVGI